MDGTNMPTVADHGYTQDQMRHPGRQLNVAEGDDEIVKAFKSARPHRGKRTLQEALALLDPAQHRFMDLLLLRGSDNCFILRNTSQLCCGEKRK